MVTRLRRAGLTVAVVVTGLLSSIAGLGAQSRQSAQSPKHMLFRVAGPKGATLYLLGSVHLLTPEAGKLPAVVDSAFAHARTIAFETSLDTAMLNAQDLLGRAQYSGGATLRTSLTRPAVARLDTILQGYGLSVDQLNGFKPWFVTVMLSQLAMQRANFQADYGVDIQLNARAHAAHKSVVGLEPVEYQFGLFDKMSPADQETMVLQSEPPDSAIAELTRIKDAWVVGDTASLDSIVNRPTPGSERLLDELVTQRNRNWLPKLEAFLGGSDDVLVVVGAAHLLGKQGLIDMLRSRGYRIEQL